MTGPAPALVDPAVSTARRRRWLDAAQVGPAVAYVAVFLVAPLVVFLLYSFWTAEGFEVTAVWTLENYKEAVSESVYRELLWNTLKIAFASACLSVLIGFAFAHTLRFRLRRWQEPLLFLVLVALFSGYLVRIYAWRTILGNDGIVNQAFLRLGLIDEPLSFLLYNRTAAIIVLTNFLLPLAILPIYAALQNVRDEEVEAARDLGAGRLRTLRTVTLPLSRDGLFFAFGLTFIVASGDYVTPQLVGGSNGAMIGKSIADTFTVAFDWPRGAALSFLTLTVFLLVVWLIRSTMFRVIR